MSHQAISQRVHELVQQYSEVTGNEYCDCLCSNTVKLLVTNTVIV